MPKRLLLGFKSGEHASQSKIGISFVANHPIECPHS
jgi:hypothetical protein